MLQENYADELSAAPHTNYNHDYSAQLNQAESKRRLLACGSEMLFEAVVG